MRGGDGRQEAYFQDFTRKGRGYLPISNLFEGFLLGTYRSKKSNAAPGDFERTTAKAISIFVLIKPYL